MTKKLQTRLHSRSVSAFNFIKDEIGIFLVDSVKFTKKGAIFIDSRNELGYWVAVTDGNEAVLSPCNWTHNMVIVSTANESFLALDEQKPELKNPMRITFDSQLNAFMLNNIEE